ncbi:MAG: hypothetical protein ACP5VE_01410 [Chthonomonadales bacterium]
MVFVRLQSLLPLHPAWSDVARLNSLMAQISGPLEFYEPKRRSAPQQVLPAALPPPAIKEAVLASRERARINRVVRQAMTRLNNLRNTLDVREARLFNARRRAIEAQAQGDIAEYLAAAAAEAKAQNDAIRRNSHGPIRDLWLKQFALETQVNGLPAGAAREKAEKDLQTTEQERARMEARLAERLMQAEQTAKANQEAWVQNRERRTASELAAAQRDLHARTEAEIRSSQQLAELILKGLEPLEPPALPPSSADGAIGIPEALLQPIAPAPPAPFQQGAGAVRRARSQLQAERARQLHVIIWDLQRRVKAIALQHGWQVSFRPVPGGRDVTQEVARLLRVGPYSFQEQTASSTITVAP